MRETGFFMPKEDTDVKIMIAHQSGRPSRGAEEVSAMR